MLVRLENKGKKSRSLSLLVTGVIYVAYLDKQMLVQHLEMKFKQSWWGMIWECLQVFSYQAKYLFKAEASAMEWAAETVLEMNYHDDTKFGKIGCRGKMLKNELVKAPYFLSRSVSYTALITVVSWVLSSSALSNMTNICHMFVLSPSPQRDKRVQWRALL